MTVLSDALQLSRGPAWPNRVVLAPMTNRQSHPDGTLSDDELQWLVRRAQGGFGIVMTCAAHVSPGGQGWPGQLGIYSDEQLPGLRTLATELRRAGARSSVQLHHGGMRADPTVVDQLVGPWDDPSTDTRGLTTAQVQSIVDDFVSAAARAESAGFDGVEIHGAHGYLVAQFLDRDNNQRSDGYGSTAQGRSRFLREIIEGIRAETGPSFQVGLRLSPERYGIYVEDAKDLTHQMMQSADLDYLDISLWDVAKLPAEQSADQRRLLTQFTEISRGSTKLGVAGKIRTAATAQECIDQGADFVTVGTGGILHHDFAARAMTDRAFASVVPPVTSQYLLDESVSATFIEYLREIRGDFIHSDHEPQAH